MTAIPQFPETMQEAAVYFANPDNALSFLVSMRWPNGVCCPRCGSQSVSFTAKRRVWTCEACPKRRQFSVKVGTIMEDSPIGLDKWLLGIWLVVSAKNGISSYELHRALGVTQKSAWFMSHRIRLALKSGTIEKLNGEIEADETYIGGKSINMHAAKRRRVIGRNRGGVGKAIVHGMLERGDKTKKFSRVKAQVIRDAKKATVKPLLDEGISKGSKLFTDTALQYLKMESGLAHEMVDHAVEYVNGQIHTNGLENFWSLLKRCIRGTYVSVEPFHLARYVDEQVFRFNERKGTDLDRFLKAIPAIIGRRLTYASLTNSVPAT